MTITDNANTAVKVGPIGRTPRSKPKRRMARDPTGEAAAAAVVLANARGNSLPCVPAKTPRATKSAAVTMLLQRPQGATPPELISATGWLPHTIRAALTTIRNKGQVIEKTKRGETTCYRIVAIAT